MGLMWRLRRGIRGVKMQNELINGKTPDEIRGAINACISSNRCLGGECIYSETDCNIEKYVDLLAYIEYLESERDAALAKVPRWISVEEYLPENEECVFITAQHDGYFGNPWRTVMTAFHTDGRTIAGESGYNWSEG